MNRYRLKYTGGAWGMIGVTVLFLTWVLIPIGMILLVDGIVVQQVDPEHPLERAS